MANDDPNAIDVPKDKVGATVQGMVTLGAQRIEIEKKESDTYRIRQLA